jgi:hypothetical protein
MVLPGAITGPLDTILGERGRGGGQAESQCRQGKCGND